MAIRNPLDGPKNDTKKFGFNKSIRTLLFIWFCVEKEVEFRIKDIHFQSKNNKQKSGKTRLNKGKMVRIWRFERQAYALGERRSIQLSYIRIYQYFTTKGRLLLRKLASCLGGECSIQLSYWDTS